METDIIGVVVHLCLLLTDKKRAGDLSPDQIERLIKYMLDLKILPYCWRGALLQDTLDLHTIKKDNTEYDCEVLSIIEKIQNSEEKELASLLDDWLFLKDNA